MINYKDTTKKNLDNHINRILEIIDTIEPGKITILTGGNSSGKSIIRKQLGFKMKKVLDTKTNVISSLSMDQRVCRDSIMSVDVSWSPTSENSFSYIEGLLDNLGYDRQKYVILDEFEIGMSRELQLGICEWLNKKLPEMKDYTYGFLVITHSETIVKNLVHDCFINIEGLGEKEWLERDIKPLKPEILLTWSDKLFKAIKNREKITARKRGA